ncbi:hypothetical protein O6H91_11G115300 [Diphasiastrum complanatum]|uniref:Uncharacterized protein n=1 Tax=Diphasiastrum complanatum TaxID=34168 RepID=A0ACC2CD63_DIPCM|nr:hypothetical protein O6H91_11G115300 [Diphasiastrum complanatum]
MKLKCERVAMSSPLPAQLDHVLISVREKDAESPKHSVIQVYAVGFVESLSEGFQIYRFDSRTDGWKLLRATSIDDRTSAVVKTKLSGFASAGVGSYIYVFGGIPQMPAGDILTFDIKERVWRLLSTMGAPNLLFPLQAAVAVKEKILLLGGCAENGSVNEVHIFDTTTQRWNVPKVFGSPAPYNRNHTATLIDDERIVISGSYNKSEPAIWFLEVNTPYVKSQKETLGVEGVAWSPGCFSEACLPTVICGPSGVGKGTLINKLMEEFPNTFGFSVSHTTRKPREKELDGVHYHFTNRPAMEVEVKEGKFLESADVHGNLYGTSIAAVEAVAEAGKRCILDIDVQGALSVRRSSMDALFIFVAPPSFEELEKRLRGRGTETEEQIQKRLRNAKAEIEQSKSPMLFDHILVNDNIDTAYEQLKKLLGLSFPTNQNGVPKSSSGTKIVASFGASSEGSTSHSLVLLDLSSLVGGAPGNTRGLRWTPLNYSSDTQEPLQQYLKSTENCIENIANLSLLECLVAGTQSNRQTLCTKIIPKWTTGQVLQNGKIHF